MNTSYRYAQIHSIEQDRKHVRQTHHYIYNICLQFDFYDNYIYDSLVLMKIKCR